MTQDSECQIAEGAHQPRQVPDPTTRTSRHPTQHGHPDTMALITSDCHAMRSPSTKSALITSPSLLQDLVRLVRRDRPNSGPAAVFRARQGPAAGMRCIALMHIPYAYSCRFPMHRFALLTHAYASHALTRSRAPRTAAEAPAPAEAPAIGRRRLLRQPTTAPGGCCGVPRRGRVGGEGGGGADVRGGGAGGVAEGSGGGGGGTRPAGGGAGGEPEAERLAGDPGGFVCVCVHSCVCVYVCGWGGRRWRRCHHAGRRGAHMMG